MFMKDSEIKKFRKYAKNKSTKMFVQSLFPDKFRDIVTQCFLPQGLFVLSAQPEIVHFAGSVLLFCKHLTPL